MGESELEKALKEAAAAVDARDPSKASAASEPTAPAAPPSQPAAAAASPVDAYTAAKRELEEALATAKTAASELKDRWMRSAADLENYKKRAAKEREEVVKFGNERLLKDLLVVLDDLDRTVGAAEAAPDAPVGTFLDGLKMVQKKFITQLEKSGVEGFEVVGKAFDPTQHEAVQQVASDRVPAGAVASEIRRGFTLNGRLLRPALVAVSMGPKN